MSNNQGQHKSNGKTRILIVDDHPLIRQGVALLISHEDDLVVSAQAENAQEALDVLEKEEIDLAIVDISLEGVNGIQLTEQIKSRYPQVHVLVLTMHDEDVYGKEAFDAGAKGYVTKCEASETIIAAIRLILIGKNYVSGRTNQEFLKEE